MQYRTLKFEFSETYPTYNPFSSDEITKNYSLIALKTKKCKLKALEIDKCASPSELSIWFRKFEANGEGDDLIWPLMNFRHQFLHQNNTFILDPSLLQGLSWEGDKPILYEMGIFAAQGLSFNVRLYFQTDVKIY